MWMRSPPASSTSIGCARGRGERAPATAAHRALGHAPDVAVRGRQRADQRADQFALPRRSARDGARHRSRRRDSAAEGPSGASGTAGFACRPWRLSSCRPQPEPGCSASWVRAKPSSAISVGHHRSPCRAGSRCPRRCPGCSAALPARGSRGRACRARCAGTRAGVELGLAGVRATTHAHRAVDPSLRLWPRVGRVDLTP